jgi:hypothetical protein
VVDINKPEIVASSRPLDEEWEEKFSSQHQKKYWKNKITGEKTWKNPLKKALATRSRPEAPLSGSEIYQYLCHD